MLVANFSFCTCLKIFLRIDSLVTLKNIRRFYFLFYYDISYGHELEQGEKNNYTNYFKKDFKGRQHDHVKDDVSPQAQPRF